MFELMDTNKDTLDQLEAEKNELEDLWKQEKDKLRATQRVSSSTNPSTNGCILYPLNSITLSCTLHAKIKIL